ncbi:MAG: 3-dehydroquinate synthase [Deltaproteobacteria bacterium]|nr:3-dehydroquinate synthase [Deltaproteobacteria bacterium]
MGNITVELGGRSYPIIIRDGMLPSIGPRMHRLGLRGRAAVVTNALVGGLYGKTVMGSLKDAGFDAVRITLPDGEEYKNVEAVGMVYDGLVAHRMERTSPVVALGGGVIGDIAGFAAATYLRGTPYIQVPTTLLAQVDSSVGGKTGVNHPMGKNLIGAFHQPRAVFTDPAVLKTLDERQLRAGAAEVIKYGVILDEALFAFMEANAGRIFASVSPLSMAIERSCRIKAGVVSVDEREGGLRAILNFGHTFGHAIENIAGYGALVHGEAVAIGMCMAAELSVSLGLCAPDAARRIRSLAAALGLPVHPPDIAPGAFMAALRMDKKVSSGVIRFILPTSIGKVVIREVDERDIKLAIRKSLRDSAR